MVVRRIKVDDLAIKCYEMLKTNYRREYSEIYDIFYGICVFRDCFEDE